MLAAYKQGLFQIPAFLFYASFEIIHFFKARYVDVLDLWLFNRKTPRCSPTFMGVVDLRELRSPHIAMGIWYAIKALKLWLQAARALLLRPKIGESWRENEQLLLRSSCVYPGSPLALHWTCPLLSFMKTLQPPDLYFYCFCKNTNRSISCFAGQSNIVRTSPVPSICGTFLSLLLGGEMVLCVIKSLMTEPAAEKWGPWLDESVINVLSTLDQSVSERSFLAGTVIEVLTRHT